MYNMNCAAIVGFYVILIFLILLVFLFYDEVLADMGDECKSFNKWA